VRQSGAEAVAVCLLHAYANPEHERRLAAALGAALPYVCASWEVNAEFREYERSSTTVLNAAVMPIADRYLGGLAGALAARGVAAPLHIVQSSGGMMSSALARRQPLRMIMSGPAAGVAAALHSLRQVRLADAVTFDMGGTSTDVCLIARGRVETARQRAIDGRPLRVPSVAVESIGAGGGSVAWLDAVGALKVGPRSAGARPGPAAYGQGGTEPTVTDANVALGYIRAGLVFGGAIRIDRERALEALGRVGRPLGLDPLETARGILEIADASMLRAIRLVSVQKGYDLRGFALIAFGGAGPLHAGRLAQRLGMPRVIVPALSSVYSAFGCLASDLRYDTVHTFRARLSRLNEEALEQRFSQLEREALAPLLADGTPTERIVVQRSLDLRYAGQNYELAVPLAAGREGLRAERIVADFQRLHQARYTYATDEDVECVNLRVVASVAAPPVAPPPVAAPAVARAAAEQEATFPELGTTRVPVYRREEVGAAPIGGPAIVEDAHSTIVVFPGQRARADERGNLHLETRP